MEILNWTVESRTKADLLSPAKRCNFALEFSNLLSGSKYQDSTVRGMCTPLPWKWQECMTRFIEVWNRRPLLHDVRLLNRWTSAGEHCRSNQLFTVHLLGGDKFSYQLNSCTSTRFRFNKELNYKLEAFLPNRNAFAFVASPKIYCTSRRVILRTSC